MSIHIPGRKRVRRRTSAADGSPPGTLAIDPDAPQPAIRVIAYGPEQFSEHRAEELTEVEELLTSAPMVWINVDGLGNAETLHGLGRMFGLHRLALEDVVNLEQRPKVEPYEDCLFVVAQMPPVDRHSDTEQLSLFLGRNFVLTFQERAGDCFDGVRARLEHGRGIIRNLGADYLVYALLDAVVDAYFPVLEEVREELEGLDDEVLEHPQRDTVSKIHAIKHRLQGLRRIIGPHREVLNTLLRDSEQVITQETSIHLRDCYDHVVRLIERVEVYREQCADLMNTHLSMVSNRMNEVMKVLTIIATIFIPLGFIAGLYGMNFNPEISPWNMPELNWVFGYPFALGLMGLLAAGLLIFFWRKGWFD